VIHALRKIPPKNVVGFCVGTKRCQVGEYFVVSSFLQMNTNETFAKDHPNDYIYECECFSARQLSFVNPSFPEDEILCHPNSQFLFTKSSMISQLKQVPTKEDTLRLEKFKLKKKS